MDSLEKRAIMRVLPQILDDLDPRNITSDLLELSQKTNNLISILVSKDEGALVKFINILKKDYEWLSKELQHQYDEEIKAGDRLRKYSGSRSPFPSPMRPTYRNQTSVTMDYSPLEQSSSSTDSRASLEKKFYLRTNSI